MHFCFSKRELSWLDDLMPESKKKNLEDAKNEEKKAEEVNVHAHMRTLIFLFFRI